MGVFADTIRQFAPSWFQEQWMRALLGAVGSAYDDMAVRARQGMLSAIPYAAGAKTADGAPLECDEEVLEWHARDRGIRLYSSEPILSKRYRLSRWHQLKKARGSHKGELENVQPFWLSTPDALLPTMKIVFQDAATLGRAAQWHILSPASVFTVKKTVPTNWNYDGQTSKRTRFWLIIHLPPGYSTAITYDDGSLYDGGAIYDGITALAVRDIVDAVLEAKAAHSRLAGVIMTSLQPDEPIPNTVSGVHYPFDPTDTAQTLDDGTTSLPTGNWGAAIDPVTHLATRPWWASWVYEDNP